MYYMYNIKLIMFALCNNMYNIGIKRWITSILEEKKKLVMDTLPSDCV